MQEEKPVQQKISIKTAPQIKQIFWCHFPDAKHVHLPEFWKIRPVIIVSYKNMIQGSVTVIPCSTKEDNKIDWWAVPVNLKLNDYEGYAICDKITTVATSRLKLPQGGYKRISQDEFDKILEKIGGRLPKII